MYFADEVRDPHDEIDKLPGRTKPRPRELKKATARKAPAKKTQRKAAKKAA